MKKRLTFKEYIAIASMLFGMFFGAGNLIFPVSMGQTAGRNMWAAVFGFLVTGVGLPMLAVAALGISKSNGLRDLSGKVGKGYGLFFTSLLYLTIGPLFAIPRCCTTSFSTGFESLLPTGSDNFFALALFSVGFFAVVLIFSIFPSGILTWIGKILNPVFLAFLGMLVITAFIMPMGNISEITPQGDYIDNSYFKGFLEGYNTMDALAGLAFGIIVVDVIKGLNVKDENAIAANTVISGVLSCILMGVIYLLTTVLGAQSRGTIDTAENGGIALAQIAEHYFGKVGAVILTITVTLACLKTAVGLVTSCSKTFSEMFSRGKGYRFWAIGLCVFACFISNVGLSAIITYAVPVLMFLYPLSITLILLALCGKLFNNNRIIYISVTAGALIAAIFDFCNALPTEVVSTLHLDVITNWADTYIPLFDIGLGWLCPSLIGLLVGIFILTVKNRNRKSAVNK